MTVTPLLNKIIVFNNGTPKGFTIIKPKGLHTWPKFSKGTKAESKKVQKILKKNINSLKINKITPYLKPSMTKKLWYPANPSKIISLAQIKEIKKRINKLINKLNKTPYLKNKTKDLVKFKTTQKIK